MDKIVEFNVRRCQLRPLIKKRGRPKKPKENAREPEPDKCSYCDEAASNGKPLFPCISYAPLPDDATFGSKSCTWFTSIGCENLLHLDCVRDKHGQGALGKEWSGTVPLAEAQWQLIGFCDHCFDEMEQNRPEPEAQDDDQDVETG